jgi:hypothetical protein
VRTNVHSDELGPVLRSVIAGDVSALMIVRCNKGGLSLELYLSHGPSF